VALEMKALKATPRASKLGEAVSFQHADRAQVVDARVGLDPLQTNPECNLQHLPDRFAGVAAATHRLADPVAQRRRMEVFPPDAAEVDPPEQFAPWRLRQKLVSTIAVRVDRHPPALASASRHRTGYQPSAGASMMAGYIMVTCSRTAALPCTGRPRA
jgi:hypothetical protein